MVDVLVIVGMMFFLGFVGCLVGALVMMIKKKDVKPILKAMVVCLIVAGGGIGSAKMISNTKNPTSDTTQMIESQESDSDKQKDGSSSSTGDHGTQNNEAPESTKSTKPTVDFDKAIDALKIEMSNKEFFPYVVDTAINIDEKNDTIILSAVVTEGTGKEEAAELADTLIRRFGSLCSIYGENISQPEHEDYGGIYESYHILVGVATLSQLDDTDEWLVYQGIAKGVFQTIK